MNEQRTHSGTELDAGRLLDTLEKLLESGNGAATDEETGRLDCAELLNATEET